MQIRNFQKFALDKFLRFIRISFDFLGTSISERIIVHSYPDLEDQSLALISKATKTSIEIIVLLSEEGSGESFLELSKKVRFIKKNSFKGIYFANTSRWIFFTHGLNWARYPRSGQISINLWHGIPFKKVGTEIGITLQSSNFVVSSSEKTSDLFRRMYSTENIPEILPFGLPRNDILASKSQSAIESDTIIRKLIWLPTYRKSYAGELRSDATESESNIGLTFEQIKYLDNRLNQLGIMLHIKSHPASRIFLPDGLRAIHTVGDWEPGFYKNLENYDGLISDFSSVIADFSLLNKPIYLFSLDSKSYEDERGFFTQPHNFMELEKIESIEDLIDGIKNPKKFILNSDKVSTIHANVNQDSVDKIWSFFKIDLKLRTSANESAHKNTFSSLKQNLINKISIKFLDQLVSAGTNILPLLFSYFFMDPESASEVFVFMSIYTLVLGVIRIIFGDFYLLTSISKLQFRKLVFSAFTIGSVATFAILSISSISLSEKLNVVVWISFGSGIGLLQDSLRFYGFSTGKNREVFLSDSIWLIITFLGYLYLLWSQAIHNPTSVVSTFIIGSILSCSCALIILRFPNRNNLKIFSTKTSMSYSLKIAAVVLIGSVTNLVINLILIVNSHATYVRDIRGLQIFLMPIGFLVGFQQINWMPKIAANKNKFQFDIKSLRILVVISPLILMVMYYSSHSTKLIIILLLFLECIATYLASQVWVHLRAKKSIGRYLITRIIWGLTTLVLITLFSHLNNLILVTFGLFISSLIGTVLPFSIRNRI